MGVMNRDGLHEEPLVKHPKKISTLEWRMPMGMFMGQDQSESACRQVSDQGNQALVLPELVTMQTTGQISQNEPVKSFNQKRREERQKQT